MIVSGGNMKKNNCIKGTINGTMWDHKETYRN